MSRDEEEKAILENARKIKFPAWTWIVIGASVLLLAAGVGILFGWMAV